MKRLVWNVGNNKKKGSWEQATVGLMLFRCDYAETTIIIIIIIPEVLFTGNPSGSQKIVFLLNNPSSSARKLAQNLYFQFFGRNPSKFFPTLPVNLN